VRTILCPRTPGSQEIKKRTMETSRWRLQYLPTQESGTIVGRDPILSENWPVFKDFPLTHIFGQFEIKRHIGNAVPPLVMKVLLEHVVEELRERDGISE
jgi:site-specific DNA-cytosine methylase